MKKYLFMAMFSLFCFNATAQNVSIIDELAQSDSTTGASVTVLQNEQITCLLRKKMAASTERNALTKGYCVQVFSENSQNAKESALAIEKKIRAKFPDEVVRTERISPFWKVRIGKFAASDEANPLKELLLKEFPELKGSVYVVKFSE
jgi:hypothetical protein